MGESALEFGFYQLHRGADKHLLCPGDSIIGSGKRQLKSLAALLRFGFTSAADVVADTPLALLLVLLVLVLTSLCGPGWCEVVWLDHHHCASGHCVLHGTADWNFALVLLLAGKDRPKAAVVAPV